MYTYLWLEAALDRLAEVYVAAEAAERDQMAAGVAAFNARLADNPMDVGESRDGDYRVAFPPLLSVLFRVDVVTRQVRVMDVIRATK